MTNITHSEQSQRLGCVLLGNTRARSTDCGSGRICEASSSSERVTAQRAEQAFEAVKLEAEFLRFGVTGEMAAATGREEVSSGTARPPRRCKAHGWGKRMAPSHSQRCPSPLSRHAPPVDNELVRQSSEKGGQRAAQCREARETHKGNRGHT